jgi:type IV pilus assembly protein PilX
MMNQPSLKKKQTGVALAISLIVLLLMTILGVTNMRVNNLEEKMAGNTRDINISFQAAESALRQGENFILNNPLDTTYTGSNGLLRIADTEPADFFTYTWDNTDSQPAQNPNPSFNLAANPRFVIKKLSQSGGNTFFKITARAVGRSAGAQTILQEYFVRNN